MNQFIQFRCCLGNLGLWLLCLGFILGTPAQAGSVAYGMDNQAQSLNPITRHESSDTPVITCGGQSGHAPASLQIRGADIASYWRSAYRMLFPSTPMAEKMAGAQHGKALPVKGPTWGVSLSRDRALLTIKADW